MEPLASRIRPQNIDEYVGQTHLLGAGKPLRLAMESKQLFSFILWGPPGCGKTTLARIYAKAVGAEFYELSAVEAGKEDMRRVLPMRGGLIQRGPRVLFIDEIHRFNKAQQDFLLPHVERGDITLIGATTENPSFEIISPLLSRCRVLVLHSLDESSVEAILARTGIAVPQDAVAWLVAFANGDARQAITILDTAQRLYGTISVDTLKEAAQSSHIRYDKKGEDHYDTISAFIKSMRAGDADATAYYLARMIEAGEDPLFIARRLIIFASEDIGLAQPTALVVANAVFEAVRVIGYPEAALNLSHGALYLALCKKDRRTTDAITAARSDVRSYGNAPVPLFLRNASTGLMKDLGYGDRSGSRGKSYLPEIIKKRRYLKKPSI